MKPLFSIQTNHPVAIDSPDHTHPWGAARDNHSNESFITEVKDFIFNRSPSSKKDYKVMDFGCAGGKLIKDTLKYTDFAVGIEGSDYCAVNSKFEWLDLHNKNLFTADLTKPLTVLCNQDIYKCDVITAWELIEHIPESSFTQFFNNVANHLATGGIFLGSGAWHMERPTGPELHVSRFSKEIWMNNIFPKSYFKEIPFPVKSTVRENSNFYFCVEKL